MIFNLIGKGFDLNVLFLNKILNDAPEPWQIGFQDSAAPGFTGIVELHNTLFFYIVIICISVFWVLGTIVYSYNYKNNPIAHKYLNHGRLVHQWYWSFEYSDYVTESGDPIEFDSYMIPESDLELGQFRLLDVDNRVVVPVDTHIRLIVTGADVIHDYAVPSLGLKIDACPGRLNQASLLTERTGVFYGQCSEICGVYHGFMPTAIEAVSVENYLSFLDSL
uniref:cytochrome c oxidase subunit 2 n=1 Tax=Phellinus igniarius TaxID=40472 RepID=UPI00233EF204|nr:cytochrome c oxidase subunit 2 [Phellinus igniarius]WBU93156.1 cytochrome c oxidase subunit 2 [Phellinus igniarius]